MTRIITIVTVSLLLALATPALARDCRHSDCFVAWYFANHTDKTIVVEISLTHPDVSFVNHGYVEQDLTKHAEASGLEHGRTISIEIAPGVTDDTLAPKRGSNAGGTAFVYTPEVGVCVRAHYRNPPTDAVKINGSTEGQCWHQDPLNGPGVGWQALGVLVPIEP